MKEFLIFFFKETFDAPPPTRIEAIPSRKFIGGFLLWWRGYYAEDKPTAHYYKWLDGQ